MTDIQGNIIDNLTFEDGHPNIKIDISDKESGVYFIDVFGNRGLENRLYFLKQ